MIPVLLLLIVIPFVGCVVTFFAGRLAKQAAVYSALGFTIVTLLISLYTYWIVYTTSIPVGQYCVQCILGENYTWINTSSFALSFPLGVDGLSGPMIVITGLLTMLVVIGSRSQIKDRYAEYYAILLFTEASIMGVFTTLNLIAFYIFWELALVPIFFFVGIWGGDKRRYASMKFMIYTFTGSTVMLLGFLAAYLGANASTFNIVDLSGKIPSGLQYLPLLATFIGFGIKLPVVPFHSWLPDTYREAPAPITVMLSGILVKMGAYGLIRISIGLFPYAAYEYGWVFIVIGVVTMFYGAIVAILSKDLKTMFAYTSINEMGFVILGAFATVVSGNTLGIDGAIFQMFVHALAVGALFMLSGYVTTQAGTTEISKLVGMRLTMPRTAGILILASAAAMAVPPFANFVAELLVISAAISAYGILAITIFVPVLTGAYFLWMIKRTILGSLAGKPGEVEKHDLRASDAWIFLLYIAPLLGLTVFSYIILGPASNVSAWIVHIVSVARGP
jgi:NADH-quinone oxidoreductase subunit M